MYPVEQSESVAQPTLAADAALMKAAAERVTKKERMVMSVVDNE
jgi:hypothetical protein